MKKHILVVDDHDDIRDLLGRYLDQHGYLVSLADGGEAMRGVLEREAIDLVVLDIMMPGEDGLTLCRYLQEHDGPPVIMLTAMSEEADTIVGLEMGADDYVTKPFSPRELLARIKAVLRRLEHVSAKEPAASDHSVLTFKGWSLDVHQHQLTREDGLLVDLSAAEFRLLKVFLEHSRQVLSRDQLMDMTKGREALPFDRSIDNQISRLRKKVEKDPKNPTLIKTVWGGGYMFTEESKAV
ncbi:response regulator [Endozoicomonas elysicola]|uniref:Chemotaxis protein CheY n=1 Tax=Endozoicomonas elysicola TaxID=305900 RepID=A0A081K7Q7_9GAMM|nr:response regulator [Endozoicomonas elysicola]KEI70183.1 chemotaxis protein CheY [Endozoicomonas elysicola]